MAGRRKQTSDNSAAIAAQFGISLKALRLYERLGMLNAPRNAAGWRVYGPAEIERLHGILSLKQLGLPLARIAELLKARSTDLSALLSVQEEMLLESRRETDHALTLIQIARIRVGENGKLSAGELAALVRSISKTSIRPNRLRDSAVARATRKMPPGSAGYGQRYTPISTRCCREAIRFRRKVSQSCAAQ